MTVVIDLESGHILWVAKGRGADALRPLFCAGSGWRGPRIQAVACDLSAASWSAILEGLPKARLVFDHFHVIKLANEKLEDLRRALQGEADILGKRYRKGKRYLLLMGAENLPEGQAAALAEALRFNEPLLIASYLKEELRELWSQPTAQAMRRCLEGWCQQALASGIRQMISLAQTLRAHAKGILNYFRHPISTGKLEGINNKIKILKRQAYGYRDRPSSSSNSTLCTRLNPSSPAANLPQLP